MYPPRIPYSFLTLLLLVGFGYAARPRPHSLLKRNPTFSSIESTSTLTQLVHLSDLDKNLDYTDAESLLSQVLVPRAVGSTNLPRLQREFEQRFTRLGWHVEKDTFSTATPIGTRTFTNLVFTHDPRAKRRFVLSAHLDSKYFPTTSPLYGFVGATDSAVPCALLYDLAESLTPWLNERRDRIERQGGEKGSLDDGNGRGEQHETLQIVLFDGEEAFQDWTATDSIYGAKHLVEEWSKPLPNYHNSAVRDGQKTNLDKISHLVLLDLLGSPDPVVRNFWTATGWLFDEFLHSERKLEQAGLLWTDEDDLVTEDKSKHKHKHKHKKRKSFFVDRKSPQSWFGTIEDDHLPFLKSGVPVVHLISVPFPQVWHTLADDATALDLDTIKAWALILRLTVAEYLGLDPQLAISSPLSPVARDDSQRDKRTSVVGKDEL
ncbi:uncharacterized protein JCM15063_000779 [Sporobolomyces koalae]|uniref:uncharacterized protein n=1 Tax=Sporobolomyces koalae TaxID=500713 RepID=UPI00316D51ED